MPFSDLHLSDALLKAVADSGYDEPTAIQAAAIPPVLMGKDLIAVAQTIIAVGEDHIGAAGDDDAGLRLPGEALDLVMGVLDDLRAGGRVVGVVSHVDELRARIPAQLRVLRGEHCAAAASERT